MKPALIVTAGTSDLAVAEEAAETLAALGLHAARLNDVGVAGIHRLLAQHVALRDAGVVILVAGMDGALPSVVGGLVRVPVIAVPTSIGYGAGFGGLSALLAMLNSCAARRDGVQYRQRLWRGHGGGEDPERAVIGWLVGFVAGVVLGGVVRAWRLRRRRRRRVSLSGGVAVEHTASRGTPGRGIRASLLDSVRDPANPSEVTQTNERELAEDLRGYLGDLAAQHGADDVMFWVQRDDASDFLPVAWNHPGAPPHVPW